MFKISRLFTFLTVFVLLFQLLPQNAAADVLENSRTLAVLFAENPEEEIKIFADESLEEVKLLIPDDTVVEIEHSNDEVTYVRYKRENDGETAYETGYVKNDHIITIEEAEEFRKKRLEPGFDLHAYQLSKVKQRLDEAQENKDPRTPETDGPNEESHSEKNTDESNAELPSNTEEGPKKSEGPETVQKSLNLNVMPKQEESIRGVALQAPTNVYADKDKSSEVLKGYSQGHILIFQPLDSDWHLASVYVNGERLQGYIHAKDVDPVVESARLEGYALKQPVSVYEKPARSAKVLKTYNYHQRLIYRSFSSQWHEATVYVGGKPKTGYIHASDTGSIQQSPMVRGVALLAKTPVYKEPSKGSGTWKTYRQGHVLKFRSYNTNWYIATVYVNGKAETGYIYAKDVETAEVSPTSHKGVGTKETIRIYSTPSSYAAVVKSYTYGSILQYRTFTSAWHEVTVYVKGKKQTGYLKADDVNELHTKLKGYATNKTTSVYSNPNQHSAVLKSYKRGHVLQYQGYHSNWFIAKVMVNGKAQTGYIRTKDVSPNAPMITGYASSDPTHVYASQSKSSAKLKTYNKGHQLKFRPFNFNWYIATVYVNGKARTGYIHKNDVSDSAPILSGYAKKSPTYVYSQTSRNATKIKTYQKGQLLKFRYHNASWYKATVYIQGKPRTGYIHKSDAGAATEISFVNPYKVYSYNHMVADIKSLQKAYPDLITYKVVGKSEYGRDIYAVSLGKGKATTVINGSHHAREWLTTNLNMYMIEQYAKAYRKNNKIKGYDARSILNETTIWFIPMVNPDGVTLQQQGLKAYPKSMHASLIKMNNGSTDFKRWKANIKGVDLNRQYDAGWKTIGGNVGRPNYKNHKGNAPATASEVKAVLKLDAEIDPEIAVAYHSSGQILYWYYKQTGSAYHRDHTYAKEIGKLTGYRLVYPGSNPSGGGYTDWFIEKRKRPGFTPEIAPYVFETNPPVSVFSQVWKENQAVGLFVARESSKLYKARKK